MTDTEVNRAELLNKLHSRMNQSKMGRLNKSQKEQKMNQLIGKLFSYLLPIIVFLVVIVVFSRYFLGIGRADLQEVVLYLHAIVFLGCAGWALTEDEHVRVDILYKNSSHKYQKWVNIFGLICFVIPVVVIIGWYSIDFVAMSWTLKEASTEPGGLPTVYLHKTLIILFPIVLTLATLSQLFKLWK